MTIKNLQQPIAVNKCRRTGTEIGLIPELCYMTGLTPKMRANFNLMKDINKELQKSGAERLTDGRKLIESMF